MNESLKKRVEQELIKIAELNNERPTPDLVVEAARRQGSALHEYFESRQCWNAKKAQHNWCIEVAREVLRSVTIKVTVEKVQITVPRFVRDPSADPKQQGYVSFGALRSDEDLKREAIVNEMSRAGSALARAKNLAVALECSAEIEELASRVTSLMERVENEARPQS